MKNIDFENKLQSLKLSKKEFTQLVGMPYQTLMNWKNKNETPYWVESWLEYYEKSKTLSEVIALLRAHLVE